MMTRALSITCPVLLGCHHSKIQQTSTSTAQVVNNVGELPAVKESTLGVEVVVNTNQNKEDVTQDKNWQENGEVVEETLQACNSHKLSTIGNSSTNHIVPEKKIKDPLSHVPSSLDRNLLDFPFITDQKTLRHLSRGKAKVMLIMRGLPGSGKSSIVQLLKSIYNDIVVCSADDYFLSEDGEYNFDMTKIGNAHGYCQNKAKSSCQNGVGLVIIDNTNVKRWEMKFYLDTAKLFGYAVVLVEPKTDWKFKPEELVLKNKHGVPLDVLKKKVSTFDHVIPLYYGWFLSHEKSNSLQSLSSKVFAQCLDHFSAFRKDLLGELGITNSSRIDSDTAREILLEYYSGTSKTSPLLHCTSRFCGGGKASGGKKYDSRADVQASCGQVFRLTLTGLIMARKTYSVRVTLDDKCLSLFERPEESAWTPQKLAGDQGEEDVASIASSSSSLALSGGKKKKEGEKKTKISKKQKKLMAKEKKAAKSNTHDIDNNDDDSDDDSDDFQSKEHRSKPSLSELMSSRISEKKQPTFDCGDGNDHTSDKDNETFVTNNQIQDALNSSTTTVNMLYPKLKNSGFARSAHITLKTAKGVTSVETNFDNLHTCDIENSLCDFNSSHLLPVTKGKAYYFGGGVCCVYFNEPIKMDAIFSGYY